MKKVFLTILILSVAVVAHSKTITVTITQEQYDAMSVMTSTPEQWTQNAVEAKANKMIDRLVAKHSDKQPDKITDVEKRIIFRTIDLTKERNERRGR